MVTYLGMATANAHIDQTLNMLSSFFAAANSSVAGWARRILIVKVILLLLPLRVPLQDFEMTLGMRKLDVVKEKVYSQNDCLVSRGL